MVEPLVHSTFGQRARLFIMEILSDGTPRDRWDLLRAVTQNAAIFRLFPSLVSDSLATLFKEGKIQVANGKCSVPSKP